MNGHNSETSRTSVLRREDDELISDYYRESRPDTAEVERRLRNAFDREIAQNRIKPTPDELSAPFRWRDVRIPLIAILVSVLLFAGGIFLFREFFNQRELQIRQELASFSSAAENILEEIRTRNENLLSAKDAQISRFLTQIEELENQRSLLLNEFALSLSRKSTQIDNELVFRVEEERQRLSSEEDLSPKERESRLAEFEISTENELIRDYLIFRSAKLDRLEEAQTELEIQQRELRMILDTTSLFTEEELAESSPAELLNKSEAPKEGFPREEILAHLEQENWISAAYLLDTLLEVYYPENAGEQLVNRIARSAARGRLPQGEDPEFDAFREEQRRRYARLLAYFTGLENLEYLTISGVDELVRRFARNDQELEAIMRAGSDALQRQLSAYTDSRDYTLLGSVSLILENTLLVELLGQAESRERGAVRLVRSRSGAPEELIGLGEILRSRGRSVEVKIRQLFDEGNPPQQLDLIYVKQN